MVKKWDILSSTTTTTGKVNVVLAWYWDGGNENVKDDLETLVRSIDLMRRLLAGKKVRASSFEWFCITDALASFPQRDSQLDHALKLAERQEDAARRREEATELKQAEQERVRLATGFPRIAPDSVN